MADNKTLQEQLDAITFKNAQVQKIKAMQEGTDKLKNSLGRNKQRVIASAPRVQGLETIKNTLGRQNMKSLDTTP
jgi:hypothetical protein